MNQKRSFRLIPASILIIILATAAVHPENKMLPVIDPNLVSPIQPEQNITLSANRFGLRLFKEMLASTSPDSNLCFSPLSVSYALAMTYNGAANKTREAMAATLEIAGFSDDLVNDSYSKLTSQLTTGDPSVKMEIANSIWYQSGTRVKPDFLTLSRSAFDATIRDLDFSRPGAAEIINQWVAAKTHEKIKSIIKPPIDPQVIMFLINAVYFKGMWTTPFDASLTSTVPFNLPGGAATECRMMNRTDEFQYFEDERLQAVDLPYGQGNFSMTVFLPRPGMTVDQLIEQIDENGLVQYLNGLTQSNLRLALPRFKFSSDQGLNETLKAMGMKIAFSAGADFSRMVEGEAWIDSVIHKTFIQVDEEGTEAAAATAVIMKKSFVPTMTVDRPFFFVIRERSSGAVLFLGRVVDPVWADN